VTGPKLNEAAVFRGRPEATARAVLQPARSARAVARYVRMSPYKVREVLDLIRGHEVGRAQEILRFCERAGAEVVAKVLTSAVANGEHNHSLEGDELFVSACFADEGPTLKRWRPRARGRATRIRKRTCHVTVIVGRLPDRELAARRANRAQASVARRSRPQRRGRDSRADASQAPPPPEQATTAPEGSAPSGAGEATPPETAPDRAEQGAAALAEQGAPAAADESKE